MEVTLQATDMPHRIVPISADRKAATGRVGERPSTLPGVPAGGDVYLLKWILHDWVDAAAIGILRSCHRAMKASNRLLLVEHVIGLPNASSDGNFTDLGMMVVTGGRERTKHEFATLLAEAGFQLISITPTATLLSLIEGALKGA
jgi:hypothetical protein